MLPVSESGYAKNVANFENLISFCKYYGSFYNPSRESLKIVALQAQRSKALASLRDVKAARTAFDAATYARVIAFKDLRPVSARVFNALAASGADKLVTSDARIILRKIYGKRAGTITADTPEPSVPDTGCTPRSVSISQESYDSLIDHFTDLVELVSRENAYAPNEAGLQVDELTSMLIALQTANNNVINTYTEFSNSCIRSDEELYSPVQGLIQTAQAIKLYIKSVFGASSPHYKQVSSVRFEDHIGR